MIENIYYKPLIVQSDMTLLLETNNALYESARDELSAFAEIVKSPEHVHTYKMTAISLWNAASAGVKSADIVASLEKYSKYPISETVIARLTQISDRYGKVRIRREQSELFLETDDQFIMAQLCADKSVFKFFIDTPQHNRVKIDPVFRGHIKQALMNIQFPPEDLAGYADGEKLDFTLKRDVFQARDYQKAAVSAFRAGGKGDHGVIVLPCGAGKTIVGIETMAELKTETLILTTSITALRQWISEIVQKTSIAPELIGEYSGEKKEIKPVTISTYQIISAKDREGKLNHFNIFSKRNWGFIIYDEVHTLPAPVFRITAELQAKRRLGLTATLVREDGHEADVFALIGPKRHEMAWKVLEGQGWIAQAECFEIRIPMSEELKMPYAIAPKREKFRIAAENPDKFTIIQNLITKHEGAHILIIGVYLEQLARIAKKFSVPLVTGKTSNKDRETLYGGFKRGDFSILVVSKVANFAIDLPDANVAIEVSGSFGSRQEEAQRLGRILRPKQGENKAYFYTLVSRDTREEDFSMHRQLFLTEQGYPYKIMNSEEWQ
ncbi:MAG: helicase-associated domain-containing protein [Nitrososphaerota archaeon]|jgi:DNA excision repair protein ERCC-3|uniref:DNA repair helicase XPB n=1 Tax=Candidatus Bathycorpusculum sp. TaxID=2994959 RepID=UPI0028336528|nr:helicase-associated domain-containing protein [Candidatus Termiticorpusculum sp.]MCL2257593.1 helicase-associated domain-containing protein [Candidatus Termiticorpusculum sp.]MCL2292281.1 helicase-associated domain-containing protein [Candidatus Termiticorpusculum sp.]MDR0460214.1 helicase-associated domain-containing protein [Nitrososphaerota archaeon]